MTIFKQTWWDNNLPKRFDEFKSWIGDKNAQSKIFFREYVKNSNYKTLIDLGCGTATEYFGYKEEYPELNYLGIDSSKVIYNENIKLEIPMVLASAEDTKLDDNHSEVIFARHLLEHQPSFVPILTEMIRLGSKIVIHVFFIKPNEDKEHIGYDINENLYHNRFNKQSIEEFLITHEKVNKFEWVDINQQECGLIIFNK